MMPGDPLGWVHVDTLEKELVARFHPLPGCPFLFTPAGLPGRVRVHLRAGDAAEVEGIATAANLSVQGCGRVVLAWLVAVRQAVIDHVGPEHHHTIAILGGGGAVWTLFEGAGLTAKDVARPPVR